MGRLLRLAGWFTLASTLALGAHGAETPAAVLADVERTGALLAEKDRVAALATDLLLAEIDPADHPELRGWVTRRREAGWRVTFLEADGAREADAGLSVLADIDFLIDAAPVVTLAPARAVEADEAAMLRARELARPHARTDCGTRYNPVVLPGARSGLFEVWLLAAAPAQEVIPLAGHVRVEVDLAADEAVDVERLSRGCLMANLAEVPEGTDLGMLFVSHLLSDEPSPVHVYTSLTYEMTLAVGTAEVIWKVEGDRISVLQRTDP